MGTRDDNNVIHRMTRVAREGYQARAMSPAKALRLALARAADHTIGLAVAVTAVEQVQLAHAELPKALVDGGLLVLLDGPDGLRGALRLDFAFLAAVIEMQTMGRLTGRTAEPRPLTRTDAAIAAPLIDAALNRFGQLLTEEGGPHWGAGFSFGAMAEDARNLGLALTEAEYHHLRLMVEIGEAALPGVMSLLLPVRACPADVATGPAECAGQAPTLEHSVLDAPVCLQAVLSRITLPLDRVGALAPGDVLPLATDDPLMLRLEVGHKHKVAQARLGQLKGLRAARLMGGPDQGGVPPADAPPGVQAGRKTPARAGSVPPEQDKANRARPQAAPARSGAGDTHQPDSAGQPAAPARIAATNPAET